eukprot:4832137-Ditylum_brightwellii.AAC.1
MDMYMLKYAKACMDCHRQDALPMINWSNTWQNMGTTPLNTHQACGAMRHVTLPSAWWWMILALNTPP